MVHHHVSNKRNILLEMLGISTSKKKQTVVDAINPNNDTSYWNGLYVLVILALSVATTFTSTLIPQHNHIEFPNHWYEWTFMISIVALLMVLIVIIDFYLYFNINSIVSITSSLRMFGISTFVAILSVWLMCTIWTIGFGYNLPVPFGGGIWIPNSGLFTILLWFEFPNKLRKIAVYRKRFLFYIFEITLIFLTMVLYDFLSIMVSVMPINMQWILAIILPMLRIFNAKILESCMHQTIPCRYEAAKFGLRTYIWSIHTLFLAIILSNVTKTTMYCIFGIESLLHFYSCYQIIKLRRKIDAKDSPNDDQKENIKDCVLDLIQSETIEVVASLAYSITLAVAYHGPNATILGNVKNSYWTYKEIEDINISLALVFQLAFMDLGIGIICGIILWIFCRINIFQEFCTMMKTYWSSITLRISLLMCRVSCEIL